MISKRDNTIVTIPNYHIEIKILAVPCLLGTVLFAVAPWHAGPLPDWLVYFEPYQFAAIPFAVFTIALAVWQTNYIIDPRLKTMETRTGPLAQFHRDRTNLKSVTHVAYASRVIGGGAAHGGVSHEIHLHSDPDDIVLDNYKSSEVARMLAQQIADALQLPYIDEKATDG